MLQLSAAAFLLPLALVILISSESSAKPDGAPGKACGKMTPKHKVNSSDNSTNASLIKPQDPSMNPFQLLYMLEDPRKKTWKFVLKHRSDVPFQGFLIQVRESEEGLPIGVFWNLDNNTRYVNCEVHKGPKDSVITHTNKTNKSSVSVMWTYFKGPEKGKVFVRTTVAQTKQMFWVNKTDTITWENRPDNQDPGGNTTANATMAPPDSSPTTIAPTPAASQKPSKAEAVAEGSKQLILGMLLIIIIGGGDY